jgi:hypothetical protein
MNNFDEIFYPHFSPYLVRGIAVQDDRVLYFLKGCYDTDNYLTGALPMSEEPSPSAHLYPDIDNPINHDLRWKTAYGLSPDGQEIIVGGTVTSSDNNDKYGCYIARIDFDTHQEIDRFFITRETGNYNGHVMDLYATEDEIVIMSKDVYNDYTYIDRYTYDGDRIDGVQTNYCAKQITQGPDGSTIYIQANYEEGMVLEVVQVNWEPWMSTSSIGSPKHFVSERTWGGRTLANLDNGRFGMLKAMDPETGETDLRVPVRSDKPLVKVRIPYEDVAAKLGAARNMNIEYKGQSIAIPLDTFACADLLAAMPCQDEATFEIILKADQAGNVTYTIDLFVVEQTNAMTKVVHRKTIQ